MDWVIPGKMHNNKKKNKESFHYFLACINKMIGRKNISCSLFFRIIRRIYLINIKTLRSV